MEINLSGIIIKVIIIRKNNKNIYFRFNDNLELVVTTNKRVKDKEILKLIQEQEKAILRLYNKCRKRVESEDEFWYLGSKYEIIISDNEDISFIDGKIYTPSKEELKKFINLKTKEILTREVNNLKEVVPTPIFNLKFRKMKTRWGVCNYKTMTITLNTELIKHSYNAIRYVIVHEMCHFKYHDHGKDFWKMVKDYYPSYNIARKELRE